MPFDSALLAYFRNSVIIASVSTILAPAASIFDAYALPVENGRMDEVQIEKVRGAVAPLHLESRCAAGS